VKREVRRRPGQKVSLAADGKAGLMVYMTRGIDKRARQRERGRDRERERERDGENEGKRE